ncbi:MAG: hypothetical protein DIU60_009650 [Actinomycetes bacterium]
MGAIRALSTAIDLLADEDPAELPRGRLAEQLCELHWQMARLQAEIARRTHVRAPTYGKPETSRCRARPAASAPAGDATG